MATPIQMPALSPTMKEGKITKWLKQEGDKVSSGEAIAECETDKSNLEIEAYEDGVLIQIAVREGESAPVGAPIGFIGAKGEKVSAPMAKPSAPPPPPAKAAPAEKPAPAKSASIAPVSAPKAATAQVVPLRREAEPSREGRLRASPLAKKMATDQGLDLAAVLGSGPKGRIIKRDIEAALQSGGRPTLVRAAAAPVFAPSRETKTAPLSTMRKVIVQRMAEVKPGVPHFYLSIEVDMEAAMQIREEAKALDAKVSVNDVIVKAAAMAVRRFPPINVSLQGDQVVHLGTVDVGIAVAIDEGLITPVLRDADLKGLAEIAAESRDLAELARKRSLKPAEYTGGSITVSNLGMFGVDSFIAVINPPQASILAVGAVADRAVVREGQVAIRKTMTVTLSGDHRVIDGAVGAQYLKELKGLLEHPMRLLV